ncbi:MAG TPA: glycosyltransferase [Candidatus Dormibacteraeota bacterium]|jgi:glycosyltransferase involved in cell wall biosynthesis|nr:glycosyltransferase [Candidatus Dormibacteraeota bacterium]
MLTPTSLEFVMVSLEGPDQYSQAGGLGVRARELCRATAALGFRTTLIFVGDPSLPAEETVDGVHLVRWAQDVSRRHPAGVYQGEDEKLALLNASLPMHLADAVVAPAAAAGRVVALLFEEWQTALCCSLTSDLLHARGLRRHAAVLWNANNVFGFERIDWGRLAYVSTLTTVSRYMKHLMRAENVDPMVIYNGIPESALAPVDAAAVRAIRSGAGTPCLGFKIGRFSADKRWLQAVSGIAELRDSGMPARLLMRGGIEPYGGEVLAHARSLGLEVAAWQHPVRTAADVASALRSTGGAAVVDLQTFLPDAVIPQIYAASTAVLANSGHEPFGLVGLEAMAAGGVALVGATGEEYARSYANAVVVESEDGAEVAAGLRGLVERPDLARRLRRAARADAREFTWPMILDGFLERLRYVCEHQGVQVPVP